MPNFPKKLNVTISHTQKNTQSKTSKKSPAVAGENPGLRALLFHRKIIAKSWQNDGIDNMVLKVSKVPEVVKEMALSV
jgi:hypothetical protein